jgi:SSS family solute:Na+ symporter/sodium/pantothenate symporter
VKSDRAVRQYLAVTVVVSLCFSALLLVGLYAHLADLPREAFIDPATGVFRQDRVMAVYLAHRFGPGLLSVITVALLAAGMSTLDGILVALSSIAGSDLVLALAPRRVLAARTAEQQAKLGHRASQLILLAMGLTALVVALEPPRLLGIFGQLGVYGIVAASAVPIAFGLWFPELSSRAALVAALVGLVTHFTLYTLHSAAPTLGFANPAVTATYGLLASVAVVLPVAIATRVRAPMRAKSSLSGAQP